MAELTLQSIKRPKSTLRDQVVANIRHAIIEGELKSGDQVNQAQIAAQLEVSRTIVREALAYLEEEGLIDNIPFRGTFVKIITPIFVEELFSLRRVLEDFAIKLFVDRAENEDYETLHDSVAEMEELASSTEHEQSVKLDLRFHYLIFAGTQHKLLMDTWRSIEAGLRLCLAQGHRSHRDASERAGRHAAILKALEAKDVSRACELMQQHIRRAEETIIKSLQWD